MSLVASIPVSVKPRSTDLETEGEVLVRVRRAIGYCRKAKYVALAVQINGVNGSIVDVPRITALRMLRRLRDRIGNAAMVHCSDVFGTLVIGTAA